MGKIKYELYSIAVNDLFEITRKKTLSALGKLIFMLPQNHTYKLKKL